MDEEMDLQGLPDGVLVLHQPRLLSQDQRAHLASALESRLPGRPVIIVDGGARLEALDNTQALKRIEGKLDALLDALADEAGSDYPVGLTLDGEPAGGPRDQAQPL